MKLHFLSVLLLFTPVLSAWANPFELSSSTLSSPKGEIILTIDGLLEAKAGQNIAQFDLDQLQALDSDSFTVSTRWESGQREYHGPKLSALLDASGAKGNTLRMFALNDYSVDIDRAFIDKYQPILAWREDGKTLTVRNKGPLWLMLPLHKYPELNEFQYTAMMIWQLHRIEVRE